MKQKQYIDPNRNLCLLERQQIFLAVVAAQDGGESVLQSYTSVAQKYHIESPRVGRIVNEGVKDDWLDDLQAVRKQ